MIVALAQTHILWENKKSNFEKAISFMERAKEKNADIIFFPEMSLTGFSMNTDVTAEAASQGTVEATREVCRKKQIAVGIGWVKKENGKAENHYTVINRDGMVCSDYIKIHPFSYAGETIFFQGGNAFSYYRLGGFTWSTFICYDLRFPEIFQIASQRAEVIVVPANWPENRVEHWKTLLRARAIENQCYILGINCVGKIGNVPYSGFSSVISPDGQCIMELSDREGLAVAELKRDELDIRAKFPVKQDRRWQFYSSYMMDC